ncbi:MAG TPA: 3-phosphoserine/phosphohydroxythreonine transaminase [Gammaproteobacteria bacterium]|jgi:phosphoserine aminotransferase|nr:3-phosphoserine/phosphohydroxythreonine transaminase [Gammaproteobacteria bacterium]
MKRVFNFSPGPAMLPEPVLRRAQAELLDWKGSGMSVMEVSHRGTDFIEFAAKSERDLRELLGVPANYKVLFLQGGATLQFAAVPLNIAPPGAVVDYVVTGNWGEKAVQEAQRYATVNVAATGKASKFTTIPDPSTWKVSKDAAYLHYTPNETVVGVEFHDVPAVSTAPLVADMSSTLLSRPIDVSKFGIIYAGAQKNIGPAGLALVIVREDLLGRARRETPGVIDYKLMAENDSMWNTPSTLSWYLAGLVFEWLKEQGGLAAMAKVNERKAKKLYTAIDSSGFYKNPVDKACRSWMNVPFTLPSEELDKPFLSAAKAAGLTNLKGHRMVGGMRASIYNAMPEAGIDALIDFMAEFAKKHG